MGMNTDSKNTDVKEASIDDAPPSPTIGDDVEIENPKKKKSKKKSKSKKRSRHEREQEKDGDVVDNDEDVGPSTEAATTTIAVSKEEEPTAIKPESVEGSSSRTKEERKAAKKSKKAALASKIPTHDADGIPYGKIALRRMKRRLKHGLDPIASEEEEREIRERERRERGEEEMLYASTVDDIAVVDKVEEEEGGDDGNKMEDEGADGVTNNNGDDDENQESGNNEDQYQNNPDNTAPAAPPKKKKRHNPPSLNTKRSKSVPPDYVCMACQNKSPNFTPHWIYDCPLKQTKKGCNNVAKRLRGLHDPPSRKVFVSGLPFECNDGDVKRFFEDGVSGGEVSTELVHLKLLKFEDSQRCKGQAFLTFDSDEGAQMALRMNGCVWKDIEEPGVSKSKKQKKGKKDGGADKVEGEKRELRLKITKVLNRFVTKGKKGGGRK